MPSGHPGRGEPDTITLTPPLSLSHSGEKSTISHMIDPAVRFRGTTGGERWCARCPRASRAAAAALAAAAAAAGEGDRGAPPPFASPSSMSVRSISLPDGSGAPAAYPRGATPRSRTSARPTWDPPSRTALTGRRVAAAALARDESVSSPIPLSSPSRLSSSSSSSPSSSSLSASSLLSSSSYKSTSSSQRTGRLGIRRSPPDSRRRWPRGFRVAGGWRFAIARWPCSRALMSFSSLASCNFASSEVTLATTVRLCCSSSTRASRSRMVLTPSSKLPGITCGESSSVDPGAAPSPPSSAEDTRRSSLGHEPPREGPRGGPRSCAGRVADGNEVPKSGPAAAAAKDATPAGLATPEPSPPTPAAAATATPNSVSPPPRLRVAEIRLCILAPAPPAAFVAMASWCTKSRKMPYPKLSLSPRRSSPFPPTPPPAPSPMSMEASRRKKSSSASSPGPREAW